MRYPTTDTGTDDIRDRRELNVRYSGLDPADHPPAGLCVASLTVLDSSGFEHELDPLLLEERAVRRLVRGGRPL